MSVIAVAPAAGSGQRLGAGVPKAFVTIDGVPILVHAVDGLIASGVIDRVLVAVPAGQVEAAQTVLDGRPVEVLVGGADRTASVRRALAALDDVPDGIVVVHDAARPFAPPGLTAAVVETVRAGHGAVVPVLPLADTVKQVDDLGTVQVTVDRSTLRAIQTPQGFDLALLRRAHAVAASAGAAATDDAGLVEALGEPVYTVPGHPSAFKITTAWDRGLAELLVAKGVR
ncbi:2-C-methyl-D-erythritol 4-phosphate cytidylyltransferase [Pseudonocardia asaccharolytica]|uniref:2-C-methyl-D-erythritol 4-phosphate cytidylyltransferase n=1 Tax=Pseudonocardia asaccharolytica DSM 44247 = NBRC 16224 TaxID=1123024 RepID=A0A511CY02_9PSEU|nr:2-C-methyl-D-erythritol 4-phosphate cytidylyltransferase [Pseudonocardia asaccharolytica]GEL17436.1 2-C-methyl-D-erythritol 4-phosphate cytidylyltransferase [Pseudonocardia asaccharolytica DSM 44247 = NBRC 16224]